MDDLSLLRDYAETGSPRSFALLVERHVNLVHSAALRRTQGDTHRAAEVTQMVFINLARKASQLSRHPLLVGWFHQSTRWAAANVLRAERRRQVHEQAAAAAQAMNIAPGEPADWETLRPLLDHALDGLRDSDREAVLLRFFSNLPFADIATRLGIGENAARMRVERALEKLHRALRGHGITSTSAALALAMSHHAVAAAPAEVTVTLAPASIAAAATASATGSLWVAAVNFLMMKVQLGLIALALALAVGLALERDTLASERDALDRARERQSIRRTEVSRLSARATTSRQVLGSLPSVASIPTPDPVQLERKRLDLIVRKGELDSGYANLFRRLHLDRPTLDSLKTLIVQRNQALYDALQVAKQENVEIASFAESQELQREATRATDRQIAALLGGEKFSQFDRYVSTESTRTLISMMAWMPVADPQSEERMDALVTLFEKTTPDYFDQAWGKEEFQPLPEAFLVQAKPLLPPESYIRLASAEKTSAALSRMSAIAREAAYQGKLKLNKSSTLIYNPPKSDTTPSNAAASPAIRGTAP